MTRWKPEDVPIEEWGRPAPGDAWAKRMYEREPEGEFIETSDTPPPLLNCLEGFAQTLMSPIRFPAHVCVSSITANSEVLAELGDFFTDSGDPVSDPMAAKLVGLLSPQSNFNDPHTDSRFIGDSMAQFTNPLLEKPHSEVYTAFSGSTTWENYILERYDSESSNKLVRWSPKPDFRLQLKGTLLPLVVYEHESNQSKKDQWRLLGQCMVYLRLARRLGAQVNFNGEARPVVMAYYTTKELIGQRYLMTTMDGGDDILVLYDQFELDDSNERLRFFLSSHNFLRTPITINQDKMIQYSHIVSLTKSAGKYLISQTLIDKLEWDSGSVYSDSYGDGSCGVGSRSSSSGNDGGSGSDGGRGNDGGGRTDGDYDISSISEDLVALDVQGFWPTQQVTCGDFAQLLTISQHEKYLAFCTYRNGEKGVLKLVPPPPKSNEAVILEKLSAIKDPHNPILPGIRISKLALAPSYKLVLMPRGTPIVYRDHAADLLKLSIQLVSGVIFLHKHKIAHLDLKRENLLLSSTGELTIIDFSISQFVEPTTTFRGFWGTPGCVAPEIEKGMPFSPFMADVWACGKILKDIARVCRSTRFASAVAMQARYLTMVNPSERRPLQLILKNLEGLDELVHYGGDLDTSSIPHKRKSFTSCIPTIHSPRIMLG